MTTIEQTPWWDGPLAGFDTETTGIDVGQDRVVTCHLNGQDWLINPGVPIPEEASAVHGVTTEQAVEHGVSPLQGLTEVHDLLHQLAADGVPVVGYNVSYDFSIIAHEWHRLNQEHNVGLRFPKNLLVIDPIVLDKQFDKFRRGSRKLSAVADHYGVELLDAHSADADAKAAVGLAKVIGKKYGANFTDLPALMGLQAVWKKQQAIGLETHLRKKNPNAVVDPGWPLYESTRKSVAVSPR